VHIALHVGAELVKRDHLRFMTDNNQGRSDRENVA
jgi:hypothetical protein